MTEHVSIKVTDSGQPALSAVVELEMVITLTNKSPVIRSATRNRLVVIEDVPSMPFNFSVEDEDTLSVSLSISVSAGTLLYGSFEGTILTINGTCSDLSQTVRSIKYLSPKDQNVRTIGLVEAKVNLTDGVGGDTYHNYWLLIQPANDSPYVSLSSVDLLTSTSDVLTLSNVTVRDVDVGEHLIVQLTVSSGVLTARGLDIASILVSTPQQLRFKGTLSAVNYALSKIEYTSADGTNFVESDILNLVVQDAQEVQVEQDVVINIHKDSQAEGTIRFTKRVLTTLEDKQLALPPLKFSKFVYREDSIFTLQVVISTANGNSLTEPFAFNVTSLMNEESDYFSARHLDDVIGFELSGKVSLLSEILPRVSLVPPLNFNGYVYLVAAIIAIDKNVISENIPSSQLAVAFQPVNDAPDVAAWVSGDRSSDIATDCEEDEGCFLHVSITDVDASEVSCPGGNVFQVDVEVDPAWDGGAVNFEYSDESLCQQVLPTLSTTKPNALSLKCSAFSLSPPTPIIVSVRTRENFYGNDIPLLVSVSDSGSCGSGGAIVVTRPVNFNILPVNDLPKISVAAGHMLCSEDLACELPAIVVSDVDLKTQEVLTVTISVQNGILLTPPGESFASVAVIEGNSSSIKVASNNAMMLSNYLAIVSYLPSENYHGVWPAVWRMDHHSASSSAVSLLRFQQQRLAGYGTTTLPSGNFSDSLEVVRVYVYDDSESGVQSLVKVSVDWVNDAPLITGPSEMLISASDTTLSGFVVKDPDFKDNFGLNIRQEGYLQCALLLPPVWITIVCLRCMDHLKRLPVLFSTCK